MSDCSTEAFVPKKPQINLEPCPFCNGEIRLTHGDYLTSSIPMFKCRKCGAVITFDEPVCNFGALNHDDTPAIIAFNTRYQLTCYIYHEDVVTGEGEYEDVYDETFCSNCNFRIEEEDNYCSVCGAKVVD